MLKLPSFIRLTVRNSHNFKVSYASWSNEIQRQNKWYIKNKIFGAYIKYCSIRIHRLYNNLVRPNHISHFELGPCYEYRGHAGHAGHACVWVEFWPKYKMRSAPHVLVRGGIGEWSTAEDGTPQGSAQNLDGKELTGRKTKAAVLPKGVGRYNTSISFTDFIFPRKCISRRLSGAEMPLHWWMACCKPLQSGKFI